MPASRAVETRRRGGVRRPGVPEGRSITSLRDAHARRGPTLAPGDPGTSRGGGSPATGIWTIGHSTRSVEEFLDLLREHAIDVLVDVRSYPGSRRCPQFGREVMSAWLSDHAVAYQHASDLGGRRNLQHDVDPALNAGWRNASFKNYVDYALGEDYRAALERLADAARASRVAFMCSEALPWRCHRSLIANTLVAQGWSVHHIMSQGTVIEHRLGAWGPTPLVADGRVTYPEPPGATAALL